MSRTYKSYSGPFAPMLTKYVEQKRALGYSYTSGYWVLFKFDAFSKSFEINDFKLTKELVEAWGAKQPNESGVYWSTRILYLQQFACFLQSQGYEGYISQSRRAIRSEYRAYVFTQDEMKRIFEAADKMEFSPASPYKHMQFPLLYRMLYGCGFRISEVLNLNLGDVNTKTGIIHVVHAKNDNERFIPMSDSLNNLCIEYIKTIHHSSDDNKPFFFKRDGSRYGVSYIEKHFREMLWFAGIPYRGRKGAGPRVHDIRHTFICHRLNIWAREKADLMTLLPILSKYVGHTGVESTQYYLKLTAEAFPDVLMDMESLTGSVFPEIGGIDYE